MKARHILILLPIVMFGCAFPQADISLIEISEIIVLDSDFNVVKIINEHEWLDEVNELWRQLKPIDKLPNYNWTHKIDIEANQLSGRWLYNKEGYLAKLNYQLNPKYQVKDPALFNKLILGL